MLKVFLLRGRRQLSQYGLDSIENFVFQQDVALIECVFQRSRV